MKIEKLRDGRYRIRWYTGGRGSARPQRTFIRRRDAERFATEIERRKQLGELGLVDQSRRTVDELAREWWRKYAVPNLADWTLNKYERLLARHIQPRLGRYRLQQITPELLMDFRASLEKAGVGSDSVRVCLVIVQAMFRQAILWRWVPGPNPAQQIDKPSGRRQRAVVCLAPSQVEAIRQEFLARAKLYAATMVSLIAYGGVRTPEELLALEIRHIGRRTLLVEQRNIDGRIIGGQKVKGFHPRAVDLLEPVRRDLTEYLMAMGIREGPVFPRSDGQPWRVHDYNNWRRREWHPARDAAGIESLPPYDLRMRSPPCRSAPACRSRSSRSRWATRRR